MTETLWRWALLFVAIWAAVGLTPYFLRYWGML